MTMPKKILPRIIAVMAVGEKIERRLVALAGAAAQELVVVLPFPILLIV